MNRTSCYGIMNSKMIMPLSTMAIAVVVLLFGTGPIVTDHQALAVLYYLHHGHYDGHYYGHYHGHYDGYIYGHYHHYHGYYYGHYHYYHGHY